MIRSLESLIGRFEAGYLGRREFIQGVLALATAAIVPGEVRAAQRTSGGLARPRAASLNHVTLAVSDIERSSEFYGRVLGATEVSRQPNGINLGLGGDSFLGLYDIDPPPRIHHFCVGVEGFEIEEAAEELRSVGVAPTIRQDRPELYFQDPDGVTVQLSPVDYRG